MEGVYLIELVINGVYTQLIDGLCDLKRKIVGLFSETMKNIYIQAPSLRGS
jgi:hypothetical protein